MTANQIKAAKLVASGKSKGAIAKQCKVSERTLRSWRTRPEFNQLVSEAREEARAAIAPVDSLSSREYRMRKLTSLFDRIWEAIRERAESEEMKAARGGSTGMVTVSYKMQALGGGETTAVPEYEIDNATSAELRAILQHAATEVGDWKIRKELTGRDNGPIERTMTIRFVSADGKPADPEPA